MKLVRYNQLENESPITFSAMLDRLFNESLGSSLRQFSPAVDIAEDEKSYEIQLALPGMKKSDFKIDLVDRKLTVSGERKHQEKKEGKNFHSVETQFGSFKRSFFLPEDVLEDHVEASYQDGLLTLVLPKKEKKNSKAVIEVK
ncbi:Hsp20/alpha crystallin family protein [Algoriphagus aestuariicola]|uniref:Hsp20/alpha crystallin family protein n=1 Tax=Algoriphagus aestuariicola TaxID=1852016 RepID=A0ABS3BPE6_9BACT|nr:Hsp20/alpha crystallin family protein [Algoriphagus aestuariicola]MBN7799529.1 Hsp20/alpha crystallin family protein [Algoriphagus aestuariicola]